MMSDELKIKENASSITINKHSHLLLSTGAAGTTLDGRDCMMENGETMEMKEANKGNNMKKRKRPKGMEGLKCNQDSTG